MFSLLSVLSALSTCVDGKHGKQESGPPLFFVRYSLFFVDCSFFCKVTAGRHMPILTFADLVILYRIFFSRPRISSAAIHLQIQSTLRIPHLQDRPQFTKFAQIFNTKMEKIQVVTKGVLGSVSQADIDALESEGKKSLAKLLAM